MAPHGPAGPIASHVAPGTKFSRRLTTFISVTHPLGLLKLGKITESIS